MSDYITKTTVLSRIGWTETAIKLFMPIPDKETRNPHSKQAPPMKLYLQSRIEDIENTIEFKTFIIKNQKKREGAKKAVTTKKERLIQYVNDLVVVVPCISKDELIKKACEHFNNHQNVKEAKYNEWLLNRRYDNNTIEEEPSFERSSPHSDESHLKRISLNFIRHCMTNYEKELDNLGGKPGKDDAYEMLKEKVNNSILSQYEWLQ